MSYLEHNDAAIQLKKYILELIAKKEYSEAKEKYEHEDLPYFGRDDEMLSLGIMYMNLKEYKRGVEFLYSSKGLNPYEPLVYYNIAKYYLIHRDHYHFLKHATACIIFKIIETVGFKKILVKRAPRTEFGDNYIYFDGPGTLYKTPGEKLETKSILKLLTGFNAMALCNDTYNWMAVNVPYDCFENKEFRGDIDIIVKRPRYIGGSDSGFTYRGFQVKTVKIDRIGNVVKVYRGKSKKKEIIKQLDILKKFGCEQCFLLEIFIIERGYTHHSRDHLPESAIKAIEEKAGYLKDLGYGYVVMVEEPLIDGHDKTSGVYHSPINVLPAKSYAIGPNFNELVTNIEKQNKNFDPRGFMTYCKVCKSITNLYNVDNIYYCFGCKNII